MSIPTDLLAQAGNIGAGMDQIEAQGMQIAMPTGQYSSRALNSLVETVNEIMSMIGEQENYPSFTEDQTALPQDFVNMIMAIMTIAEDAQVPVDIELQDIVSDREIARLVALLKRLSKDSSFQQYLEAQESPPMMEEAAAVEALPEGGEMTVSDDELFASRMR
ncbi:MAG: hypothetical protein CMK59_05405 [Proteobacteria bacterium]|nr:hypothetical protein [Pseudomonadota bacterium]|tara:strand:+ start:507 stop:995 length:489 start_codon:yes stop_codon:yes gene_type:complete